MKILKKLALIMTVLLMGVNLTSCGDDVDEPSPKSLAFSDLVGTWLSEDGSADYILVTTKNYPKSFYVNRMTCYWGGIFTDNGVPVVSNDGNGFYLWGCPLKLEISNYQDKKGKMTVYNPINREEKKFYRTEGSMAIIKNPSNTTYRNVTISVYYESDLNNPVYTADLGEITLMSRSEPFWTGGKRAVVEARMEDYYSGEYETARWKDIEPGQYYTLEL